MLHHLHLIPTRLHPNFVTQVDLDVFVLSLMICLSQKPHQTLLPIHLVAFLPVLEFFLIAFLQQTVDIQKTMVHTLKIHFKLNIV